ncbi:MAG: hydrogenase maturation nickel metallochaperone HypA [Planctomycetes bacterium]|nr:hydrogenase maturation nickel metallochaperone HypA [Planctomycetota bacterium]
MHETGLIRRLIQAALAAAEAEGGGRVTGVGLKVGALTGLSEGHLREHWDEAVPGTPLEGAALRITCAEDLADPDGAGVVLEWIELG